MSPTSAAELVREVCGIEIEGSFYLEVSRLEVLPGQSPLTRRPSRTLTYFDQSAGLLMRGLA
jgi:hypothetical protein